MLEDLERGHSYMESGDWASAADAFRAAIVSGHDEATLDLGRALRRLGDASGAREAYEAGERQGDPRATCNLGALLEEEYGDEAGARAAYLRADAANFPGGAYALGQLAWAAGDVEEAIRWNRRGDELGDGESAFNLGIAFTRAGRADEAAEAFRRADERGVADGSIAIGRLHMDHDEFDGAIAAFRRADERGHPQGAAMLGAAYAVAGRLTDALEPLRRAAEGGDEAARELLKTLDPGEDSDSPDSEVRPADQLQRHWLNLLRELERDSKEELARAQVARAEAALKARELRSSRIARIEQFQPTDVATDLNDVLRRANLERAAAPSSPKVQPPATFVELRSRWERLEPSARGSVRAAEMAARTWDAASWLHRRRTPRPDPRPELWPALDELARLWPTVEPLRAAASAEVGEAARQPVAEADALARKNQQELELRAQATRLLVEKASRALPPPAQPWTHGGWREWEAEQPAGHLRLGEVEASTPQAAGRITAPVIMSFPPPAGLAIEADVEHRPAAVGLARSTAFRALAAVPPGQLRLTFVDPVAIGQSVADFQHLGDYDPLLVDTKPWVQDRDIEARMDALASHAETVISKYLRGQYATIDEYNEVAGEVSEPYRLLVVFDYPTGFTERSSRQLLSLIENGPRCGIHTILTYTTSTEAGSAVPVPRLISGMQKVTWAGDRAIFTLASPLDATPITAIAEASPPIEFGRSGEALTPFADLILRYGGAARNAKAGPVTLERLIPVLNRLIAQGRAEHLPEITRTATPLDVREPETWWQARSGSSVAAPLGRTGAGDVTGFFFSSTEIAGGGIMVGLPRSGKTTALHAAITMMCLLYGPEELELYLIDAKHGVEFKAYESLPHARMVSIHSEREFSLAILKSLDKEIARRAELMKSNASGHANITSYRQATGEVLPRVVLIMDEFHEIFEEDDRVGRAAFDAFSNIVRQGPFAGVHLVVASQTLSSMPAMDRSTLTLLPERVAFMCNEVDADLVMGDENRAVRHLTKPGEGIFNPLRGVSAENKPFQGLLISREERSSIVAELAALGRRQGWTRVPRVFDGDALVERPRQPATHGTASLLLALGEPYDLRPSYGPRLHRQRGGNLLILGSGAGGDDGDGVQDQSAASAMMWALHDATCHGLGVDIVDFSADPLPGDVEDVQRLAAGIGATYVRGRGAVDAIGASANTVRARHSDADYRSAGRLLALVGVHRARIQIDLTHRPYGDEDDDPTSTDMGEILKNGPDVGVHVLVTAPNWIGVQAFLGHDPLPEFTQRIAAGAISPADMYALSTGAEQCPPPRRRQAALVDASTGLCTSFRCFIPPALTDLHNGPKET